MSRTPPSVWVAIDAARGQAADERDRALAAEHDDDLGDELAEREGREWMRYWNALTPDEQLAEKRTMDEHAAGGRS